MGVQHLPIVYATRHIYTSRGSCRPVLWDGRGLLPHCCSVVLASQYTLAHPSELSVRQLQMRERELGLFLLAYTRDEAK